ncbi:MAG: 50S ribosome-binding GTPase [Planctomycetes bacterium]|nr:50S ribosome-binding GTPase [Planctomycetota bacterium]MCL4729033.1 50S ribosome-binding GTPase [Planctomycetota bacterium]
MSISDTIFALATPPAPSVATLVRASGPACRALHGELAGPAWRRGAVRAGLVLAGADVPCMVVALPGPDSYTGEDTLEIFLPGHPWATAALSDRLLARGLRQAQPGEFTRRALDNGRISPVQAAAVLALVNAQTESDRRHALAELSGHAARVASGLAERLRALSARHEMLFDFAEEEHADAAEDLLLRDLNVLAAELSAFAGGPPAARPAEPLIALFGPPNAGKSSLFNALLGTPRALVSPRPGTTRDPVRAPVVLEGRAAVLVDLSGVGSRDADAGRFAETAREHALRADVLLVLAAPGQHAEALAEFRHLLAQDASLAARALWLDTMTDLAPPPGLDLALPRLAVSAASGAGLAELRAELAWRARSATLGGGYSLLRERAARAAAVLNAALNDHAMPAEARAREVRHGLTLLDEGLMTDAPGDVLDHIFARFCIGK